MTTFKVPAATLWSLSLSSEGISWNWPRREMSNKSNVFFFSSRKVHQLFQTMSIHDVYQGCQSFRTQVISYLLWSFRTYFLAILYPVTTISYSGHFVPILVILYLGQLGTKWLYGGQFVPKSFRTIFCPFVPIFFISYPAKMDGLTNGRTAVFWLKWQINVLLLIVT